MPMHRASLEPTINLRRALVGLLVLLLAVVGAGAVAASAGPGTLTHDLTVEEGRLDEPTRRTRVRRSNRARHQHPQIHRHRRPAAGATPSPSWSHPKGLTPIPGAMRWSRPPRRGPPLLLSA